MIVIVIVIVIVIDIIHELNKGERNPIQHHTLMPWTVALIFNYLGKKRLRW
jgi:hypothetical protein